MYLARIGRFRSFSHFENVHSLDDTAVAFLKSHGQVSYVGVGKLTVALYAIVVDLFQYRNCLATGVVAS